MSTEVIVLCDRCGIMLRKTHYTYRVSVGNEGFKRPQLDLCALCNDALRDWLMKEKNQLERLKGNMVDPPITRGGGEIITY